MDISANFGKILIQICSESYSKCCSLIICFVKVGYGDIGGYRDGAWADMLAFPLFAIIFGILHNLLAVRIFHKRGGGMTKFFLISTTTLILGAFLVQVRLLGEA